MSRTGFRVHATTSDETTKAMKRRLTQIKQAVVQVGVFSSMGPLNRGEINMAQLAVIHEFGAPKANIPERSFMRAAMTIHRSKYNALIQSFIPKILRGDLGAKVAISRVGAIVASDMQALIVKGIEPALSKRTLIIRQKKALAGGPRKLRDSRGKFMSLKGFKPLLDSGQLIKAITYKTIMKGVGL